MNATHNAKRQTPNAKCWDAMATAVSSSSVLVLVRAKPNGVVGTVAATGGGTENAERQERAKRQLHLE
jgi:hypothetical protein